MNQQSPQNPNANLYPNPQNQEPKPNQSSTPQQKVSFWKSKDPAIVIVRIVIYIFIGIPVLGIIGAMVLVGLSSYRNAHRNTTTTPTPSISITKSSTTNNISSLSANDQQIAAYVIWLSSQPLTYYQIHKTYVGWTPDTTPIDSKLKSLGSEIKIQGIGASTYVIYANLPDKKDFYCNDATRFSGEVTSVSSNQTTCK